MDEEGSIRWLGALGAIVVIVGFMLLRNWVISEAISGAGKGQYAFPTPVLRISITPWAVSTPWYQPGVFDLSTPTPVRGDVYIVSPHR